MIKDYSNQREFIARMQRENRLEKIGKAFSKAKPFIAVTLAGIALVSGITYYASKTIKPYVDKAAYQIEEKWNYQNSINNFLEKEWTKKR